MLPLKRTGYRMRGSAGVGKSFSKAVQKDRCGEAPALQQIRGGQMLIEGVVSRPFQPRKGASSDYCGQQRGERCAVDRQSVV